MPKLKVGEVTIAYEVGGEGTPLVMTPGGWFPRSYYAYLMGGIFSAHTKVLLWDRRNSGASEIKIEDTPSECQLWADDLHLLLKELQMAPAILAGSSAGSFFSLYMAHRYPHDVKGLILLDPATEDVSLIKPLVDAHYFRLAEVAERQGMAAVIAASLKAWVRFVSDPPETTGWQFLGNWVAECIQLNPASRESILSTDPKFFAAVMRKWGEWFNSPGVYRAHLSYEELARINVPALVLHGFDPLHPPETARELATLLPHGQFVDFFEHYTQEELRRVEESDSYTSQNAFLKIPFIEAFLRQYAEA